MLSGGSVYEVIRTQPCTPKGLPTLPSTTHRSALCSFVAAPFSTSSPPWSLMHAWSQSHVARSGSADASSGRGGLLLTVRLDQLGHALGRLGPLADPVVDAVQLQLQAALLA